MPLTYVERMRVQWVDTDASGLIHYTAALRYFEVAEHALMRRVFAGWTVKPFMLPRVHVEADYKSPLRYADEFDCAAWIAAVGTSSVTYRHEISRPDGTLCIVGKIVAVAVDEAGRSIPLPSDVRAAFEGAR